MNSSNSKADKLTSIGVLDFATACNVAPTEVYPSVPPSPRLCPQPYSWAPTTCLEVLDTK